MANEAFALSPISAHAASPSDADFEAIREAFLETSRGRWFLDEYTRRNRNADTAMVLEAVARIEGSLAAQKAEQKQQEQQEQQAPQPSNELPEAMAAVRAIVAAARASVETALAGTAFEDALAPSRKCARVIREIAWGLRESGADGRICSLLESQVDAINTACDHVAAAGLGDHVLQAFDQAAQQIDSIGSPAAAHPAEPVAAIHVADPGPAPVALSEEPQGIVGDDNLFELVAAAPETAAPEAMIEAALPDQEYLPAATVTASAEIEMAPAHEAQLEIVDDARPEPVAHIAPEPVVAVAVSTLGESLIASGIIAKPASPRSDPLAPIRRMSQVEKVAFFS